MSGQIFKVSKLMSGIILLAYYLDVEDLVEDF